MQSRNKIEPLKKVTLALEAGSSPAEMDITDHPVQVEFIYGLGAAGLSPFEYALADKASGDEVLLEVHCKDLCTTFHLLHLPFITRVGERSSFFLKTRITAVAAAGQREIIRAMAAQSACGDDCGCGCGNH